MEWEHFPGLQSISKTGHLPVLHLYNDVGLSIQECAKTEPQIMPLAGQWHLPGVPVGVGMDEVVELEPEHKSDPGVEPMLQAPVHLSPRRGLAPMSSQM